ncbi:hypothetical protein TUM3794_20350 [Shewanella colwelliana]|uniref:PRTRC system protein B n=1 Tax=Shewanella colwelliana TaxID=23 RepID=A0ABQ4P0I5_SHECO|nr:PRTRC system protein B [Shewanella colwelliana]GIU41002.1 hypothetical protein TUM3794_20350 [Shewanella colwelliana]
MDIQQTNANDLAEQFIGHSIKDELEINPQFALVVHGNASCTRSYITRHDVVNGSLGIAQHLSTSDLIESLNNVSIKPQSKHDPQLKGFLASNVLLKNSNTIMWHIPRQNRTIYMTDTAHKLRLPPLLFSYSTNGSKLSVYALPFNKRPELNTKLYRSPFYNIYEDCRVCLGSMKMPKELNADTIKQVEDEFFNSRFTHSNCKQVLRKKQNVKAFYAKKEKADDKILVSELQPLGITLNELINKLA